MFTGIIAARGRVVERGPGARFVIDSPFELDAAAIGASIACSGVCLTVVEASGGRFAVEVSDETRACTTAAAWRPGTALNLERALRVGDELGGHMVLGHVDGVAEVVAVEDLDEGSRAITFAAPPALAPFIAAKGSVAIDGVSLTVNRVEGRRFAVNVIPHTRRVTTLGALEGGGRVNLEIDVLARYVARLREESVR